MGRYFGIGNKTKNHIVSEGRSCWKGEEFCECHAVMHLYGWDVDDEIYSACYDTYCKFEYKPEEGVMDVLEDEVDDESSDEEDDEEDIDGPRKKQKLGETEIAETKETCDIKTEIVEAKEAGDTDTEAKKEEESKTIRVGFNPKKLTKKAWEHAPQWKYPQSIITVMNTIPELKTCPSNFLDICMQYIGRECALCDYTFNPKKLEADRDKYDDVFCMA